MNQAAVKYQQQRIPEDLKWTLFTKKVKENLSSKHVINLFLAKYNIKINYRTISRIWNKYRLTDNVHDLLRPGSLTL